MGPYKVFLRLKKVYRSGHAYIPSIGKETPQRMETSLGYFEDSKLSHLTKV